MQTHTSTGVESGQSEMVTLKCEGAACNKHGVSADDLYSRIHSMNKHLEVHEAIRLASMETTKLLENRVHVIISNTQARCTACGHVRVWGGKRS